MSWPKYRIEVSIKLNDGADEYDEIGFCAGDADSIDAAAYMVGTSLQRREWETEPGMPDPESVDP